MNNLYKLISSLKNQSRLLFPLCLIVMAGNISNIAIAQNSANNNESQLNSNTTTRKREKTPILATIWQLLIAKRKVEPALSSRSNICEITPGLLGETNLIYSDRPLFLWQSEVANLEVHLYTPFSVDAEQEILWMKSINDKSQNIVYTGKPLQPGKIYDWEIVTDSQTNRRRISFQIMDAAERDLISEELTQLERELTASGATKKDIILAKANYFAEKDLWSDSLQQLHYLETVPNNDISPNKEMMSYICHESR